MTLQVILLALATSVRPPSIAAVYTLLSTPTPRRLTTAYVVAGLAVTVTFGILVALVFKGIDTGEPNRTRSFIQLACGALIITLGAVVASGRVRLPDALPSQNGRPNRWYDFSNRHLSVRTAAIAGPATHIPGLFYLIALNLIAASQPGTARAFVQVIIYNVVWFAVPIAALGICIFRPESARSVVGSCVEWARSHTRAVAAGVAFAVGGLLVVEAIIAL